MLEFVVFNRHQQDWPYESPTYSRQTCPAGFPICFVVPWVVVRALMEDYYCWRVNINNGFFWIVRAPTIFLLSLLPLSFSLLPLSPSPSPVTVQSQVLLGCPPQQGSGFQAPLPPPPLPLTQDSP